MESKKRRGRPSITEKIAGSHANEFEQVITSGKKYRSRRSIVDAAYVITSAGILSEAASEIDDLELICCDEYQCRSILN